METKQNYALFIKEAFRKPDQMECISVVQAQQESISFQGNKGYSVIILQSIDYAKSYFSIYIQQY